MVGWGLVAAAVAFFVLTTRPSTPTSLGFDTTGLTDRWNAAAQASGRPELSIDPMVGTATPGVVGHAWSPDLRVVARTAEDAGGEVVELVAVGNPGRDGAVDVTAVFDLVIQVVAPRLDGTGRQRILANLGLTDRNPPAELHGSVSYDRFRFRATSSIDTGDLGIGVVPDLPA